MALRKAHTPALHPVHAREHARDFAGLTQQLASPDPVQRRHAARDLAALPQASQVLGQALARETDPSVRQALFTSLGTLASAAAVQALIPLLRSEDAGLRNGAIETLSSMPEVVGPSIQHLLRDPDPDVRLFTVNLLGDLRHDEVNAWLCQVLRQDSEVNVVAAAIEVLAETGSGAERAALLEARSRFADDPFIGFATQVALERIEAP
ncbi:HEAT repeat domain-containing protein [Roseateles depolymerans]|uniref:PBS lyase HEAT domain-containing protein repeat-containing protein n=1 Tax=Roseateles depolymerans TaxID=76731 RepID=A0A0U3CDZ9_9BURK|nr:HEAT repeat domain-containing protein [Roseateles depolymerans]ALV06952.1 PBS lyase HEAT domain-containing protein repeat-containing protein [Roseateles depolymerans]REG19932.1 HEAT repeat protein [Roseateles depolymerans]